MSEKRKALKGSWGGKREGAGRPKTSPFVPHLSRPPVEGRRTPVKIVLRLRSGLPSLREPAIYEAFAKAASRARRFGLRIIEYSVLKNAVHMICEFKTREELERSFKSLNTTLAIALKRAVSQESGRRHNGPIFLGRYHLVPLENPAEVKAALREVLLKASETLRKPYARDRYSSGLLFDRWRKLLDSDFTSDLLESPEISEEQRRTITTITASPQFWLTKTGWMKA